MNRSKPGSVPWIRQDDYEERKEELKNKALVVIPNNEEGDRIIAQITCPRSCGECRFFNRSYGQQAMYQDNLVKRLTDKLDYNLRTLAGQAGRWDYYGLCEYFSGGSEQGYLVHALAPARIPMSMIGQKPVGTKKDLDTDCPSYIPRGSGKKEVRSYRMTRNSKTIGT